MKVLLESRVFYPSIGGLEKVSQQLAEKWTKMGHDVRILSQTPLGNADPLTGLNVIRRPSLAEWRAYLQWADLFVQSGISLKSLPLALAVRKPVVFIHHNMLPITADSIGARMILKRWAARLGHNIAVSRAVAADLPNKKTSVIYNLFSPSFIDNGASRDQHTLLFVGRLVSVKGADVAFKALSILPGKYKLILCGDGPDREFLEKLAGELQLSDRVEFKGWVTPQELNKIAQRAVLQIIPSRYEPFGIVALEAIASGCSVVASKTGGLPEAVGPCGILVEPDNPGALADGIIEAIGKRDELISFRQEHLKYFKIDRIAEQYINVFKQVVSND